MKLKSTSPFCLLSLGLIVEVLAIAQGSARAVEPTTLPKVEKASTSLTTPVTSVAIPVALPAKPIVANETIAAPIFSTSTAQESAPAAQSTDNVRILAPTALAVVDVPAVTVVVQYPQGSELDLRVNGVSVPADLIGRTETDSKTQMVTRTWYGVSLKEGKNTLTAQAVTAGQPGAIATTDVQVRGDVQKMALASNESRIPADGKSTATVRGQLLDEQGNRSNRDAVITVVSTAGDFVGVDAEPSQPGFQVKAHAGEFTANLRSGLEAKTVTVRALTGKLEAFTQVRFETNLRPSIATGVIDIRLGKRGTDFYRSFREFLPADGDNSTQLDVYAAAFATGKVGNWLFTGAFNNSRPLNQTCDGTSRLFRDQQACQNTYPVYGDSSQSTVVTPSTDSLYLRFERNAPGGFGTDYAMWGDYNTEEFARKSQQFTATTRQLHGFKGNYNLGDLQVTAFYGNNVQGFQRDTIAPDGTSGYYFLSRRILVEGSENIFLETEELNRPGTVIDRQSLSRGPDYEIDYSRGSVLFRRPVFRTDVGKGGETLVRRIVVTYQYDTPGSDNSIYAGRVQYNLSRKLNQESWIGGTYLQEDRGAQQFQLYGADAFITLGPKGSLIAEYAHSTNDSDFSGKVSGSAYRIEAEGELAEGIQARGYWRSTDPGFTNTATTSFVAGQTRYGANINAKISDITSLRAQYDHESNFGVAPKTLTTLEDLFRPGLEAVPGSQVDNSLTTLSVGVQQKLGKADLQVDWVHRDRKDNLATGNSNLSGTSDQLRSRLTMPLTQNLTLFAQNELTFSSNQDALNPDRTLLGLNWAAMPGVNVRLAQQFFTGKGLYSGQSLTSLDITGEHKLGPDTTLTGRYSVLGGTNGITGQGAIGLKHLWTIAPGLRLDAAYEHVFGNSFVTTGAGTQFAQPYAVGQSASALGLTGGDSYSVGLEYTDNPNWKASARFEHRSSSQGSNTVINAALTGKLSPSLTALMRYQQANAANQGIVGLGNTANFKLGLAYRDPRSDKFNALLRYEYRKNPAVIPDTILFGNGTGSEDHTFAVEGIYAPNWRWEFYGKYALRNSTTYLASDLVGNSTTSLAQVRTTYRFSKKWDVVGEARWISQPDAGFRETGLVLEAGYYLTPNLRLAAGYSFGRVSDRDFDGSRSAGGVYLGLTVKINELFSGFGLQKVAPPQQQESVVKPVAAAPPLAEPANVGTASSTVPAVATVESNRGE